MDEKTLRTLDYFDVLDMLAAHTATPGGRERSLSLRPEGVPEEVARRLAETGEAVRLLAQAGEPPARGFHDIRVAVERGARQARLEPEELLSIGQTVSAMDRLGRHVLEGGRGCPQLLALAGELGDFSALAAEIGRAIAPEGDVADGASPLLADLRRQARSQEGEIRQRLEAMARSASLRTYLQESIVTLRQDRYVLPVKQEHRGQVPGIIHDQSASGATLFVEPMAAVVWNNRLRELRLKARREEERVLDHLSALVAAAAPDLRRALHALAGLDLALAKGRLARDLEAVHPVLNDEGVVDLKRARHPLLGERAVPVDIRLGEEFDILIITGPNTGGKTVSLKTLGLFALMTRVGLFLPAAEGSRMSIFRQVFADIGDEQGIQQNLSTFSSHMANIAPLARQAGPGSLVLLDEVGAGTDPAEGAGLAMALLEHLQDRGARVVATTHAGALKAFAYERERAENAAVEFDAETLAPTYRLFIGAPGRSHALEIAQRLGLPGRVVRRARELTGAGFRRVDALLETLERDRLEMSRDREEAARTRAEAEGLRKSYEERLERLERRREEVLSEARQEAGRVLEGARREARQAVRRIREVAEGETLPAGAALARAEAARQDLHAARRQLLEGPDEPSGPGTEGAGEGEPGEAMGKGQPLRQPLRPEEVRPGLAVVVSGLGAAGQVLEAPDAQGRVTVQVGGMRLVVEAKALLRAPGDAVVPPGGSVQAPAPRQSSSLARAKAEEIATEIHLRRLSVEEALEQLDKYIDDALLAGLPEVRIIHGKGTGTLRQVVGEYLRNHPVVASVRTGGPGEGGSGVTVARFKNA